ncbi:hypothetical protein COO60DRAFT_1226473 [Scenedesmus sp. NREL 46B-D3]|nr:hypothetical protein COO60DRAFT_1226473 [Scenedesmus sp. NREL 46B-D3]
MGKRKADELWEQAQAEQALRQAAAAEVVAGVSGDLQEGATIPAALADQGFTQQQQQQQQHGAWDSDDACSDAGTEFSVQDDGEYASAEDEGAYVDAADTAAFGRPVEPAHGTAQWYRSNLAEPLWQSGEAIARLRIHQAVFMLMAWKADHCVRDNAFAELLGMLSMLFLPEIMQVRDISSIKWHSCEAGCTGWAPTPKDEWHKHKDDRCPKCNGMRFKDVVGKDVPVRVSGLYSRLWVGRLLVDQVVTDTACACVHGLSLVVVCWASMKCILCIKV